MRVCRFCGFIIGDLLYRVFLDIFGGIIRRNKKYIGNRFVDARLDCYIGCCWRCYRYI